jgi:hypothetical protein
MLLSLVRRIAVASFFVVTLVSPVFGQRGEGRGHSGPGTGNPDEHLVPWMFLSKGGDLVKGPLVLYWLPASTDEMKRSSLLTSHALLEASARCVQFEIVLPDDAAAIEKLGATGRLPFAVLVDSQGRVTRTIGNVRGSLSTTAVERLLAEELGARDEAVFRDLTEAKRRAGDGEKEQSIDLYKKIWDDRCLFPLIGTEAQRALKGLGVIVHDTPAAPPVDPNLKVTVTKKPHEH